MVSHKRCKPSSAGDVTRSAWVSVCFRLSARETLYLSLSLIFPVSHTVHQMMTRPCRTGRTARDVPKHTADRWRGKVPTRLSDRCIQVEKVDGVVCRRQMCTATVDWNYVPTTSAIRPSTLFMISHDAQWLVVVRVVERVLRALSCFMVSQWGSPVQHRGRRRWV